MFCTVPGKHSWALAAQPPKKLGWIAQRRCLNTSNIPVHASTHSRPQVSWWVTELTHIVAIPMLHSKTKWSHCGSEENGPTCSSTATWTVNFWVTTHEFAWWAVTRSNLKKTKVHSQNFFTGRDVMQEGELAACRLQLRDYLPCRESQKTEHNHRCVQVQYTLHGSNIHDDIAA